MNAMKKIFLLIFEIMLVLPVFSQNRYGDVYEIAQTLGIYDAYQQFCSFQSRNNTHANACYQIGVITQGWITEYDPFLQRSAVDKNVKDAQLFLSLAKHFITESSARSDARYYKQVKPEKEGKNPTFVDIIKDIDSRLNEVNEYKAIFDKNSISFQKSVSKYNKCVTIFNDINHKNSRLKDLYFLFDDSLKQQLAQLHENFDSSLFYLNRLQQSLKKTPIGDYKFNYSLNPITIYRLNGLTLSNFLSDSIPLWDFGGWIEGFEKIISTEVDFLYNSTNELNTTHGKYINSLSRLTTNDVPKNYEVSPLILNKMYKYDFNSLAAALLIYQNSQVNYLYDIASFVNDTSILSIRVPNFSNYYFYNILNKKNSTDSLLRFFSKSINTESIRKYDGFFSKNYGGEVGLKKYVAEQTTYNSVALKNVFDRSNRIIINSAIHDSKNCKTILYKNEPIFMELTSSDLIWDKGYFVHASVPRTDKKTLLAGTYVNKGGQKFGFVAVVDTLRNVHWLKTFKQGESARSCVLVNQINDEIVTVMTTKTRKSGAIKNYMYVLDWDGNTKLTKEIKIPAVPRNMIVDDISYSYVLTFKGKERNKYAIETDSLYVCRFDSQLNTTWRKSFMLGGYVENIIRSEQNFYIYGAYQQLTSTLGDSFDIGDTFNAFVGSINETGNWQSFKSFDAPFSYYPLRVAKVDSRMVEMNCIMATPPYDVITSMDHIVGAPYYLQISFNNDVLKRIEP